MLKTWCSYEFKVSKLNDNSLLHVTLKMYLMISLKNTRIVLMFNMEEGDKKGCKNVVKFQISRTWFRSHNEVLEVFKKNLK